MKTDEQVGKFEATCKARIQIAALITTDCVQLNLAILNDGMDLYFTNGTYATATRLEGMSQLHAVTPAPGPADREGG